MLHAKKVSAEKYQSTSHHACLIMFFFTLTSALLIGAEDNNMISLLQQLKTAPASEKSALLNQIAERYPGRKDAERRLFYGKLALKHAGKHKQNKQQLDALANITQAYFTIGEFNNALATAERCLQLAEQRGKREEIVDALDLLAVTYGELSEFAKAIMVCERINGLCTEMSDSKCLAYHTHLIGRFRYELGDIHQASETFKKAMVLYQQSGNLESKVQLQVYVAMLTARAGNLAEAWSSLLAAEKECLDNNLGDAACRVYHAMGRLQAKQKKFDQAVAYFQKGINRATEIEAGFWRATFYQELGSLYQETNDLGQAQVCFENALQFDWNTIDFGEENIVDLLLKIADIQIDRKKANDAMVSAGKALDCAVAKKSKVLEIQARFCISRIHRITGNYRNSLSELRLSLKIARKKKDPELVKETYGQLADLYLQWGKKEKSRKYSRLAEKK